MDEEAGAAPAKVEPVAGTDLARVTLTADAAERIQLQTGTVVAGGSDAETIIPYAAVFYGPTGETWAYVSPAPLTFVRESITVARIDGDRAVLSDGPAPGTAVVTVGAAELFGSEIGLDQ